MKKILEKVLYILLAMCCFMPTAIAESPYRASVTGDIKLVKELSKELRDGSLRNSTPFQATKALRVSFSPDGLGRTEVVLNTIAYKDWNTFIYDPLGEQIDSKDIILLSGYVTSDPDKRLVAGSIYNSNGRPTLFLLLSGRKNSKRSAYIQIPLDTKEDSLEAKISSITNVVTQSSSCGTNITVSTLSASPSVGIQGVTSGSARISTDADPEYYAAYGADTNAYIATLVNAAGVFYKNQLSITLMVGDQRVYTSQAGNPYTSTNAGDLLSQFQNNLRNTSRFDTSTAYHLFTGKDLNGSTIGIAFLKTICSFQEYSIGVTQKFHPSTDASTFAHELGHNFGAAHDPQGSGIMASSATVPGATSFSQFSINEISTHLSNSESCLDKNWNIDAAIFEPALSLIISR